MADGCTTGIPEGQSDSQIYEHEDGIPNGSPKQEPGQKLWPRSLLHTWTVVLLLGTCLLYCARMAMPICAVTMAHTFQWSKTETGLVLGGFFWGYCLTQVLGGHISDRIGGERVLLLSAVSWSAITITTPLLALLGSHSLAVMTLARFLMGILQGVHYPSLASLCSQRVTEGERGFLMSTLQSGSYLGTLLAGGVGSLLLEWYGWESVFYCIGLFSALWAFAVWQYLLKGQIIPGQMLSSQSSNRPSLDLSWLRHLKQPSVWSMVLGHTCHCSISFTLLSWLPTFFKDTFPHSKGWVYNVIPWLVAIPCSLIGGYLSDHLIRKGYDVAYVRKAMQVIAMGVSSVFILLLCQPITFNSALVLVSASLGLATFSSGGLSVNVQDLAPSCAGGLYGFMNMCGAFMGLVLVSFSGYLIQVTLSWSMVFSLITLVHTTGLMFYLIFGAATRVDQ